MKYLSEAANIFGKVSPPPGVAEYQSGDLSGLPSFVNNILKLLIIGAGIYSVFNLVLAGYDFLSAGDDPKKVTAAWSKIWQTLLGLAVIISPRFTMLVFYV